MSDLLASAAVLVLAGGSGTRLAVTPKQLYVLAGKTLVQRAVETYRGAV